MIWGCFSSSGVGNIIAIDGKMKSENYMHCLENEMLPSATKLFEKNDFIFQDDSAPCHRSKKVKKWHQENQVRQLVWPGNSPDLNPIENLWAILKQKVRNKEPKNKQQLINAINDSWEKEIPQETCQNLVLSMKRRIELVIAAKGGHIKY